MTQAKARRFAVRGEFGGELVLVDAEREVAHRLDPEAAAVFRACDGSRDLDAIARAAGLPASRAEALLAALVERDIVDLRAGDTRRALLHKLAVGGAATAVASVLLPTAAQAFASRPLPDTEAPSVEWSKPPVQPGDDGDDPAGSGQPTGGSSAGAPRPVQGQSGPAAQPGRQLRGASSGRRPPSGSPVRTAAGSGPQVAGAGDAVPVRVPAGELPFTGSNLASTVGAGAALAATGVAVRRVLREDPPPAP